jgi:alkylation response protein AidB-like acyl-CoA dehydrogenase
MHWLGQAQRAFDLMCVHLRQRRTLTGVLADKQLMHQHVFAAYSQICAARSLLRRAAAMFDANRRPTSDVSAAKVTTSQMINNVLDSAVQVFGAEGCSIHSCLWPTGPHAQPASTMDPTKSISPPPPNGSWPPTMTPTPSTSLTPSTKSRVDIPHNYCDQTGTLQHTNKRATASLADGWRR